MKRRFATAFGAAALSLALAAPASADPGADTAARGHGGHGGHGGSSGSGGFGRATLTGFAVLPALTFVPGSEASGAQLGTAPVNGVTPPFTGQPVQGFSGIVRRHDGTFDALSDNGYGSQANSADFLLRVHRIKPDFRRGTVRVLGGFDLSDPDGHVTWPLTRADRKLTGADFDVESIVRTSDGTYWIGDEFGPFLLHVSSSGRLLEAPVPLPGVKAPENPSLGGAEPDLGRSKGFEGMARSVDGRTLYPLLEGTVAGDPAGTLRINEFDLRRRAYTGKRWTYTLDGADHAIGDMIAVDRHRFLVIERDNLQGDAAKTKKIYLIDLRKHGLGKTLVADLLDLANPRRLGGFGETFRFPFQTIEDVVILDDRTLGVLDDNNFPFSSGRTPGRPDDNEFITVRLARSLNADPRARR
ncbi:esterase-like activity of phytase family protein [Planomonospora parontospora]|uniref:esterase-like activity of phytase family protein n=1 Tax=Planomonospora parontospora TaxID=58119 RepID=UPI0016715BBE|nr:esterase-like activity of phytase family protein [Planomonospora parontospora]GGL56392.1 glycerophosphoryl diester phosphodiesterase [Planomonospora parontospora subsp. antibiotica]GII19218.1 glycerophosphoryl diester phosphodiesterase [Planomonospora parontospora subsp. antibiotica]